VGFFLLTVIVAGIFYPQLPAEVAYHFSGNVPDKVLARGAFIAWMIVPQVFFTILGLALTRIMLIGARYAPPDTPLVPLLPLMGNMVALPQVILFAAMLQLFLYNAYHTGVIPLWIIALIFLIIGTIILAIYFTRIIRRYHIRKVKKTQE